MAKVERRCGRYPETAKEELASAAAALLGPVSQRVSALDFGALLGHAAVEPLQTLSDGTVLTHQGSPSSNLVHWTRGEFGAIADMDLLTERLLAGDISDSELFVS